MANRNKRLTAKVKPVHTVLCVASWGKDAWINHNYTDGDVKYTAPLVFTRKQMKIVPNDICEVDHYACHYKNGKEHGGERISDIDNNIANIWTAESMLKAFTKLLTKRFKEVDEPTITYGQMDDNRNDVYAHFPNFTMAVHIARPDSDEPEDWAPIWYSYQVGHEIPECFPMEQKKEFYLDCVNLLSECNRILSEI